ncbi:MAG TPA: acetylornithine/succinylornithine family transaminase [Bacillota bacterium]|nr:acetylornithine/succinylornithine family transaminase [Bacillota bacterium]
MTQQQIIALDKEYIANTYSRFPVALASGKGSIVTDFDGREYIDLGSGIAVNAFGHCDSEWQNAVTRQMGTLCHCSNLYTSLPQTKLAEQLCSRTGMKKVFFSNSGAEANECAIKTARKYAHHNRSASCSNIITLTGSFHGRTVTTLAATGQDLFHTDFQPFTEGFVYTAPNDTGAMLSLVKKHTTAAVLIELIQGEGGVNVLDEGFVTQTAMACAENDVLLIIDEVQTGNGRTGTLYLYEQYGITPDIVTTAKGLGGGLPIGATLMGEKCQSTLGAGKHGSTFGGNPLCCAGALSVLSRIDCDLLEGVKEREALVRSTLEGADGIEYITGKGLLLGVKTVKKASEVIARCLEDGVLVLSAKDKVRLLPAFNIPIQLLKKGLETIKKAAV